MASRLITLYRRRDVQFTNEGEAQRAAVSAKKFLADSFSWQHDSALMLQLRDLLGLAGTDGLDLRWKVQRALETGELVTVPDAIGSGLNGSRGNEMPRPRSVTFTPSQLFKRATDNGSSLRSYTPPRRLWDFPAMDGLAIWAAKPGDVLPDGSIAKAITTTVNPDLTFESVRRSMLGDTQPFTFSSDSSSDAITELAARGVSEADEAECFAEYERNLDLCSALGSAMGGSRGAALCRQNAFDRYQQCRGF